MKVFVHVNKNNNPANELDTYSLAYDFKKSQFYMLLSAPYIIYADPRFSPSSFEFYPNGVHIYFDESGLAADFFKWLQKADSDATESFNRGD